MQEARNSVSGKATGGAGKSRADAQPPREAGPLNNCQESSGKLPMALGHLCVRVRVCECVCVCERLESESSRRASREREAGSPKS